MADSRRTSQRRWLLIGGVSVTTLLVIAGTITTALTREHHSSPQPSATGTIARTHANVVDPFDAKTLAATKFDLYYPKSLPGGYSTNQSSVTSPQAGVVVFAMQSPQGGKLYMSQEARPAAFDFGGYYKNFTDLQEDVTPKGTIAAGHINDGQTTIGSLATNGTWILANTTDPRVTPADMVSLLKSLSLSH